MSIVLPAITALGTTWYVELFDDITTDKTDETHRLVSFFLANFEQTYSRFIPNSTLSKLNAERQLITPDAVTIQLLQLGQHYYEATNGIFNILLGEHLIARGYDSTYSFYPTTTPTEIPSPISDLIITDTAIILKNGQLDLGGYGKGFLIDQLASYLTTLGFKHFLINGGGDMYGTSDHGDPIVIYLEHPTEPGTYIGTTTLFNQGFAASSTHKRRWQVDGRTYSHIIDTTNNRENSSDNVGTYLKAKNATTADVWATTLLITNPEPFTNHFIEENIAVARFDTTADSLVTSSLF